MKFTQFAFTLAVTALGSLQVQAQTADDVVSKYLDAIGGKDKLASIKSLKLESNVQVMGNEAPSTIYILYDKGFRLETQVQGQQMIQAFNDKGAWQINPMAGSSSAQPMPDEAYKAGKDQFSLGGPFYNYAARGAKVDLVSKSDSAIVIKYTSPDKVETTYTFDPKTYYIVKAVQVASMMGQQMEVTRSFSDFRKTDFGIVFPFASTISYGGQFEISTTTTKITPNPTIDPKIFDQPKG